MRKLSLEAIEIVDAIDRYGSFAAAAERLHRVPSTISYAVAKIEEQLGLPLFARNGPRIQLTPAGDELLREGRWLLAAAGDLESRMRQIATGYEAELRIAHDSLLPTSAFIDDIRDFEALQCGTRLRLVSETLSSTWEALREDRADLIIAAGDGPAGGGYKTVPVGAVAFVFCVAPTHPLAHAGHPLTRADLLAHTAVVVGDRAQAMAERTIGVLAGQPRLAVPDMATKIACQVAGLGHGFVPRDCVQADIAAGRLVECETEQPRSPEPFWLAYKPTPGGQAAKWWRERLARPLLPAWLRRLGNVPAA